MSVMTDVFRITKNCDLRYTPSGEPVTTVVLAYNYGNQKKENGFYPSQFIEAELWGKRAESLQQQLKKGIKMFCVIEEVHIKQYNRDDGTQGFKLVGRLGTIKFVGTNEDSRTPAFNN